MNILPKVKVSEENIPLFSIFVQRGAKCMKFTLFFVVFCRKKYAPPAAYIHFPHLRHRAHSQKSPPLQKISGLQIAAFGAYSSQNTAFCAVIINDSFAYSITAALCKHSGVSTLPHKEIRPDANASRRITYLTLCFRPCGGTPFPTPWRRASRWCQSSPG